MSACEGGVGFGRFIRQCRAAASCRGFLASCYHKPCDDLAQGIDWAAGAKFARLNYEIARELADADARPKWNKGDFFATKFASPQVIADH